MANEANLVEKVAMLTYQHTYAYHWTNADGSKEWFEPCEPKYIGKHNEICALNAARAAIREVAKDLMNQNMTGEEMVDYLIDMCDAEAGEGGKGV